jgi:hypothetical protein
MTARQQAEEGVILLNAAVLAYLEPRSEGATPTEIREALGLSSPNVKGHWKVNLLWGLLNLLVQEGKLDAKKVGGRNICFLKR